MEDFTENCWNEKGIYGDGSCRELAHLIHCSRCRVYSQAGRQHLDQDLPEGYLEERTSVIAQPKEMAGVEGMSVLVFRVFEEWFAIKTIFFQEAGDITPVHTLPLKVNRIFRGIVNINGELLLCLSIADLLGLTTGTEDSKSSVIHERMLVVECKGQRFVFSVHQILGVHRIDQESLNEVPSTLSLSARSLSRGIFLLNGHHVGLLDEDRLFPAMTRSLNQ